MPPQRQRLTTEELSRIMGMLECGSSQQGLPSSLTMTLREGRKTGRALTPSVGSACSRGTKS